MPEPRHVGLFRLLRKAAAQSPIACLGDSNCVRQRSVEEEGRQHD